MLLNKPPRIAPAIPPINGDTANGKLLEMDAPIVAKDAEAASVVESDPLPVLTT